MKIAQADRHFYVNKSVWKEKIKDTEPASWTRTDKGLKKIESTTNAIGKSLIELIKYLNDED